MIASNSAMLGLLWMGERVHRLKNSYDDVISAAADFLEQNCNTYERTVCNLRETMLKNKPHLVTFHESILVRL